MGSSLASAALALGQLGDPRFVRTFALGVGLALALLAALAWAVLAGLGWLVPDAVTLPWIGPVTFLDELASGAGLIAFLVASIFLMVPVAALFTGLFLDDVADAVEARHYPALAPARRLGLAESVRESLGFFVTCWWRPTSWRWSIYLLVAPLAPFVFWAVNGFLLGREYFQLVAVRRLGRAGAKALRRRHPLTIWIAGVLMAVPLTIPVVNLAVPILGAATFTHLFHRLWDPARQPALEVSPAPPRVRRPGPSG